MLQNSKEWHEWRRQGIGGSDAGVIMGVSKYMTPMDLYEEKLGLKESFSGNYATEKGQRLEPAARAAYELQTGKVVPPTLCIHPVHPFLRCSLDGITEDMKIIAEFKYNGKEKHEMARNGIVPPEHLPQCQHNLMVSGAEEMHYFSFNEGTGYLVVVKPDSGYINELLKKETIFWANILSRVPPELTDRDFYQNKSKEFTAAAQNYLDMKSVLESMEIFTERCRQTLLNLCDGHARVEGAGVRVTKSESKGSVNYKSIPELNGVDLEKYRGKSVVKVTVRKI